MFKKTSPDCSHLSCFACDYGRCKCLVSNDFRHKDGSPRPCPFFKTTYRIKQEELAAQRRHGK